RAARRAARSSRLRGRPRSARWAQPPGRAVRPRHVDPRALPPARGDGGRLSRGQTGRDRGGRPQPGVRGRRRCGARRAILVMIMTAMRKTAYLTIDDGPSVDMVAKVDYLAARRIPAVWFCRGDLLAARPEPALHALAR